MGLLGQALAVGLVVMVTFGMLQLLFFVGMRRKWRPVMGFVVAFTKRFLNPRQMRTAGTPGAYASIVRHRGRKSGRAYETPVGITAYRDGFVISLPYGESADWMRNVVASGSATIVHEGETVDVDDIRLVPVEEVADAFSPSERRTQSAFHIDHVLWLHRAFSPTTRAAVDAPADGLVPAT